MLVEGTPQHGLSPQYLGSERIGYARPVYQITTGAHPPASDSKIPDRVMPLPMSPNVSRHVTPHAPAGRSFRQVYILCCRADSSTRVGGAPILKVGIGQPGPGSAC